MMQAWTPEGMAFLQDAMACCGYYPALARRIAPYLPKQAHVCDAGCGLGGLSVALLPYCRHVTAVDRAAAPLENLRQRAGHDPPSHGAAGGYPLPAAGNALRRHGVLPGSATWRRR